MRVPIALAICCPHCWTQNLITKLHHLREPLTCWDCGKPIALHQDDKAKKHDETSRSGGDDLIRVCDPGWYYDTFGEWAGVMWLVNGCGSEIPPRP